MPSDEDVTVSETIRLEFVHDLATGKIFLEGFVDADYDIELEVFKPTKNLGKRFLLNQGDIRGDL